ncbi:MAG: Smr/MutS family protein [Amaricoccus sp.]
MAGRGRRSLTPEEGRLWHEVTASARPLHGISTPDLPPPVEQAVLALPPAPRPEPAPARPLQPKQPPPAAPALDRAHPHMDRRRFDKLRRGRLDPEARIDLHGMTSERAHAALAGFVRDAHARDLRLVLVITGKGRPDEAALAPRRHGILRHSVPHWLATPPLAALILQVAAAHQRHGGTGALYVYLRRRRE